MDARKINTKLAALRRSVLRNLPFVVVFPHLTSFVPAG